MPQIQDYGAPEVEAQGAVGGVSPNLELSSAIGRGLQNVGAAAEGVGDIIHRKDAAKEISNVYSTFAQGRADFTQQVNDAADNGTLDSDKVKQNYADWVDQQGQDLSTGEGKDFFNRQAARLGGALMSHAAVKQSMMEGKKFKAQYQEDMNNDTNTVFTDPSQFQSVFEGRVEATSNHIDNGDPGYAANEEALHKDAGQKLAEAAIRGTARQGDDGPDNANAMLDSGTFDKFLSADQKLKIASDIKSVKRGNLADQELAVRLQKEQKQKNEDAWEAKNFPGLVPGSDNPTTARDVVNAVSSGTIRPEKGEHLVNIIKANSKQPVITNDDVYTSLAKGIVANDEDPGKVFNTEQILAHGGKDLSIPHMNQLVSEFNKTKYAQDLKQSKGQLYKAANALKYPDMSSPTPMNSSGGNADYANFLKEAHSKENAVIQQGGDTSTLYDPNNKDGLYPLINKYMATPGERMRNQAHGVQQAAIQKVAEPRKAGESAADYLARTKK